jgi:hypothetical protein
MNILLLLHAGKLSDIYSRYSTSTYKPKYNAMSKNNENTQVPVSVTFSEKGNFLLRLTKRKTFRPSPNHVAARQSGHFRKATGGK